MAPGSVRYNGDVLNVGFRFRCVLAVVLTAVVGCEYRENQAAHDVPLTITRVGEALTAPAADDTVAVSMVFTTRWTWLPTAMYQPEHTRIERARIDRIESVRGQGSRLFVPKTGSTIVWGLAFIRGESDAYAFFKTGFIPVFSEASADAGSAFAWEVASHENTAEVRLKSIAAATQPSDWQGFAELLSQKVLWDSLRDRHTSEKGRAEVGPICESVVVAADAARGDLVWMTMSPEQATVVAWCRRVATGLR